MGTYLIGPFLALLPAPWRAGCIGELYVDWPRATAVSGLVEGFGALALLIVWYSVFVTRYGGVLGAAGGDYGGFLGLFLLGLHPLTWLICYFGCEGLVRFLGAVVTGESCATLPLVLVASVVAYAKRAPRGRPVPDEVISRTDQYDLEVASWCAKDHWKYPLTLRYGEQFYQVVTAELRPGSSRPYVYFLRRLPANEIIKGLEDYDPNGALPEETPSFLATLFAELRRPWSK